jgi:hypothetical protein
MEFAKNAKITISRGLENQKHQRNLFCQNSRFYLFKASGPCFLTPQPPFISNLSRGLGVSPPKNPRDAGLKKTKQITKLNILSAIL